MTPVHHARNYDAIDVAKDFLEWFAFVRRALGEAVRE